MWYDYIGEEQCGWRMIRKGSVVSGEYNFINHKQELLFSEWLEYAESFDKSTLQALIGRHAESDFKLINYKGEIVGAEYFPF